MQKKICRGPKVCLLCIYMHLYAQNMHKICKICKHESHMQNMQKYAVPILLKKRMVSYFLFAQESQESHGFIFLVPATFCTEKKIIT